MAVHLDTGWEEIAETLDAEEGLHPDVSPGSKRKDRSVENKDIEKSSSNELKNQDELSGKAQRKEINRFWVLKKMCEDLKEIQDDEGEFYLLRIQEDGTNCLAYSYDGEHMKIDKSVDPEAAFIKYQHGDIERFLTPLEVLETADTPSGTEIQSTNIDLEAPIETERYERKANFSRLCGYLVCPGLGDIYEEAAKKDIERLVSEQRYNE